MSENREFILPECGTPNYMCPEIWNKKKMYNPKKADVWALGVVVYKLASGKFPFIGRTDYELGKMICGCKYERLGGKGSSLDLLVEKIFVRDFTVRPVCKEILKGEWVNLF